MTPVLHICAAALLASALVTHCGGGSPQRHVVPVVLSRTVANIKVTVQGENAAMTKVSKVAIEPPVQFRIVSMDTNFILGPSVQMVELQWLDKSIDGGMLDLSHPIIPEAPQGTYQITAMTDQGETIGYSFEYEVKVHLPSVISILDKEATMKICGKRIKAVVPHRL
ncbi:hypothetical protein INR49_026744 [Caranx melampygus]|nr:hypothetical protein INR49_026744 [Caranx melampygus]